jgi:hypothetical protein
MLRSLIAKEVEGIKEYKILIKRINNDPIFRYTCGFCVIGKTLSASTYSRFIGELKDLGFLDSLLEDLVKQAKKLGIIDGILIAIGSSKLESYDQATPKSKIKLDGEQPDWGMKKDTDGNNIRWFGWKVHIATDTKSGFPIAVRITPASTSDSVAFIPLIADIDKYYDDISNTIYYLMDSGHDCQESMKQSIINIKLKASSLLTTVEPMMHLKDLIRTVLLSVPWDTNERTFSRLKEYLGLKRLTLKGIMKTKVHVLPNCINLIADMLAVNMKSKNAQTV